MNTIEKYLERYAEPVKDLWPATSTTRYQSGVLIPAFDEAPGCLSELFSRVRVTEPTLAVLVINAPVDASPEALAQNRELLSEALLRGEIHGRAPLWVIVGRFEDAPLLDLAVLHLSGEGLDLKEKEGVGKARKWGFDLALELYRQGRISSPYFGSTDADALLPENYFEPLSPKSDAAFASALLYPYEHVASGDPELDRVMAEVEASFRYHVLGLALACSPYAYHSLGSAFSVHLSAYAQVRGVPNRQAGEDFHLLAKLAKLGPLRRLREPRISLRTRESHRVPFGTGPSLSRALLAAEPGTVLVHHPEAFRLLGLLLEALIARTQEFPDRSASLNDACPAWVFDTFSEVIEQSSRAYSSLPSPAHRLRRLHETFDALRTLQFLHQAKDNGLHQLPLSQAQRVLLPDLRPGDLDGLRKREELLSEFCGPGARY